MKERVVRFGPEDGLVGILSEPDTPALGFEAPAVVLLNAGVLHRAGPLGWYTTLARRLAGRGRLALRFDLSGIGDSAIRNDTGTEVERALADIRSALHFLARRGVERFVLFGLCSGAMFAHHAAVNEPRIAGAVFLDGFGYPTLGYRLRHLRPRLLRLSSWIGALHRLLPAATKNGQPHAPPLDQYFLDFPPRLQVRAELQAMLARGMRMLFVYTGGLAPHYFNDRRQFREMFGNLQTSVDQLQVDYEAAVDHLYSDLAQRERMFERVETWLESFPAPLRANLQ